MSPHWKWVLGAALLLAHQPEAFAGQTMTLADGNSVEILAEAPIQSTAGWSGLMLKYRTAIPLTDVERLRQEAKEIWQRFVVDVERGGFETAIISANEPEAGFMIKTSRSYNFVFEKKDGAWRMLDLK